MVNEDPAFIWMKVAKDTGTSVLRQNLEIYPETILPYHMKDHREKRTLGFLKLVTSFFWGTTFLLL